LRLRLLDDAGEALGDAELPADSVVLLQLLDLLRPIARRPRAGQHRSTTVGVSCSVARERPASTHNRGDVHPCLGQDGHNDLKIGAPWSEHWCALI
jgi:hypothetical protein